jgi:hypothetical protein
MQSTAMGGKINLDQLKDIARQFVMNNYPSAGQAIDKVDSITDKKSADAYINQMYQTAMANRANRGSMPNPQQNTQQQNPQPPQAKTNANGTPKVEPQPQTQPTQAKAEKPKYKMVNGKPVLVNQPQSLSKDVEIIQQEPIMLGFKGQQYALNDQGQWFHMSKPTVPVSQSVAAFLDQQHNLSLGIK